jgi:hypothetical protein
MHAATAYIYGSVRPRLRLERRLEPDLAARVVRVEHEQPLGDALWAHSPARGPRNKAVPMAA